MVFGIPDQKDIRRFKHSVVEHADTAFNFYQKSTNKDIYITNWTHKDPLLKAPLEDFLRQHDVHQFLVIKNDSIVFEYVNKKISKQEYQPAPTFSIAKSFISASMSVAMQQGYIKSINDLVKTYLPELNYDKNFDILTINHLLNQQSGINESVENISDANYGKIDKVLKKIKFEHAPGEHLKYVNTNYTLLGILLERATGQPLYRFFSNNIWKRIGTSDSAVWGYDQRSNHTRAFSCFGSSTRDYAKFGRLYLKKGFWNGQQVIDSTWILASTSYTNSLGASVGYNNSLYIGEKEIGDYNFVGMYRQQIYVNPKSNVIIVCLLNFKHKNLSLRWWQILRQISEQA